MKSEETFLREEISHIEWARGNGMSATIYDDFIGTFRRRLKDIKEAKVVDVNIKFVKEVNDDE